MNPHQTTLPLTFERLVNEPLHIHRVHNNEDSQKQYDENKLHFIGQNAWVLNQLLSGRRLRTEIAKEEAGIEDLRARIHSLKKYFAINHKSIPGSHGKREWYMTGELIELAKEKLRINKILVKQ